MPQFFMEIVLPLASPPPPGGTDFESINSTLVFPQGSVQGDIACIDIRIYDNLAFSKTRVFTVHIIVLEIGDRGLVIHDPYANVSIFNNDGECDIVAVERLGFCTVIVERSKLKGSRNSGKQIKLCCLNSILSSPPLLFLFPPLSHFFHHIYLHSLFPPPLSPHRPPSFHRLPPLSSPHHLLTPSPSTTPHSGLLSLCLADIRGGRGRTFSTRDPNLCRTEWGCGPNWRSDMD